MSRAQHQHEQQQQPQLRPEPLHLNLCTEALWQVEDERSELLGRRASGVGFGHGRRLAAGSVRVAGLVCVFAGAAGTLLCVLAVARASGPQLRVGVLGDALGLSADVGSFLDIDQSDVLIPANEPALDRHDGNLCLDDEELFQGLCYKQCSLLTTGEYPVRTSSWTCWKGRNGTVLGGLFAFKSHGRLPIPCKGFDVAGDSTGGGCPHSPGACLNDEELYLNYCYKKCSLLTDSVYTHRVAAATCCKVSGWRCIFSSRTSKEFRVGGGKSVGGVPPSIHKPLERLTEALNS